MNIRARVLRSAMIVVAAALASCGSEVPPPTSVNGGTTGNAGNGSGGASSSGGTGGANSSGGGGGSATSSGGAVSGSAGGSGTGGGGNTFAMFDAGMPTGSLTGQQCLGLGTSRTCCMNGSQSCTSAAEFAIWGPCLDPTGAPAMCGGGGDAGCGMNETGKACDASVDAPPPPPATPPALCKDMAVSTEPEILVGYSPALGHSVGQNGQIKVWVNDENPPFIAPGEQIDPKTGQVKAPGNRIATALDGLLWEPALYIAPDTPTNGGRPHFPQWVKGWYDNNPPNGGKPFQVPGMDPVPPGIRLQEIYTAEHIWDVSALGLAPGTYTALFAIHDGDDDRAIGCVTITITP